MSLVEFMTENNRETEQLISNLRNVIAKTNAANDTTFGACEDEDNASPAPLTPRPMWNLPGERLSPSSAGAPVPSPYPSPSPSPPTRLDRTPRTPVVRRMRDTSSAVNQIGEMAMGTPETPNFNCNVPRTDDIVTPLTYLSAALDFLGISGAPCSTPLRSAREVEQTTAPSSFLGMLGGNPPPPH